MKHPLQIGVFIFSLLETILKEMFLTFLYISQRKKCKKTSVKTIKPQVRANTIFIKAKITTMISNCFKIRTLEMLRGYVSLLLAAVLKSRPFQFYANTTKKISPFFSTMIVIRKKVNISYKLSNNCGFCLQIYHFIYNMLRIYTKKLSFK